MQNIFVIAIDKYKTGKANAAWGGNVGLLKNGGVNCKCRRESLGLIFYSRLTIRGERVPGSMPVICMSFWPWKEVTKL